MWIVERLKCFMNNHYPLYGSNCCSEWIYCKYCNKDMSDDPEIDWNKIKCK